MGVETAIAAAVVGSALAGAGVSAYGAHQERKAARTQRRNQNAALAAEKQKELEKRNTLIDQQRENLGATGTGVRGFSASGIKANIDKLG